MQFLTSLLMTWTYYLTIGLNSEELVRLNEMFNIFNLDHKMYKYCDAVQKRFEKFVEKAKQKATLQNEWNLV